MFRDRALYFHIQRILNQIKIARNFVHPEQFEPERWMGELAGPHNVEAFVPFAYGPGVCIGKPVALYNMK